MNEMTSYLGWKIDYANPAGEPAFLPPSSMAWRIYKNPIALGIGGVAAVLLEFADARIRQVGNVMIDTLAANLDRARERHAPRRFGLEPRRYLYVTLHRPSNVDTRESLGAIASCLLDVSRRAPVVFPVHPRTRQRLHDFGLLE